MLQVSILVAYQDCTTVCAKVTVKIAQIVSEIASDSDSLGKTEMKKVLTFTKNKTAG
jgi:hypothetical protein